MPEFFNDFIGFSFNGIHSKDLHILRVSGGSRYEENLTSQFQDEVGSIEGGDGSLYWDTFFTNRTWKINIAFDKMTEYDLRRLRIVFNPKQVGQLIFDECPYKAYDVKIQSPISLQTICFMEDNQRIYKGEGEISFISYKPYAINTISYIDDTNRDELLALYPNLNEWEAASGLTNSRAQQHSGATFNLYNCGDVPTDFECFIPKAQGIEHLGIILTADDKRRGILELQGLTLDVLTDTSVGIYINTHTRLIQEYASADTPTKTLLNKYIVSGDFFQIPTESSTLSFINLDSNIEIEADNVQYHYLYY